MVRGLVVSLTDKHMMRTTLELWSIIHVQVDFQEGQKDRMRNSMLPISFICFSTCVCHAWAWVVHVLSSFLQFPLDISCRMFRQGMHDLKVWPNVEADGSEPTKTPGRTSSTLSEDQMSRLAKVRANSLDWCQSVLSPHPQWCTWLCVTLALRTLISVTLRF